MYCTHCGAQIPDGSAFCSQCGKPVVAPVEAKEAVQEVAEQVGEAAAPVVEQVEEAIAPVVEQVGEAAAEVEAAAPAAVDSVEEALARLRAEMEAAGELEPASAPVIEEVPTAPAAQPAVAEAPAAPVIEPVVEDAPAIAPVIPVPAATEQPAYVEPAYVESAAPAYAEPTTIAAPIAPVEVTGITEPVQAASAYVPAEPVQAIPTPTQSTQQAYTPQAYTSQPQAQASYTPSQGSYTPPAPQQASAYSYQPQASAPVTVAPAKKSPIAKLAIGAVALALVGFLMFMLFGRGGSSSGGGSGSGGSGSGTATPVETTASGYDILDSKGNPTVYSIMELDGSDLVKALEDEGFEWNGDNKWWISSDGNDCFYVSGNNDYEYTRSEISSFDVNGDGGSAVYITVVDDRDYRSASDAFHKLCNVEIEDETWLDDELGLAIVKSPSGTENFAIISVNDDIGLYIIDIFNEDAIDSGLLKEYIGSDYGSTLDEIRGNLF